jgi:hypothetical protein
MIDDSKYSQAFGRNVVKSIQWYTRYRDASTLQATPTYIPPPQSRARMNGDDGTRQDW